MRWIRPVLVGITLVLAYGRAGAAELGADLDGLLAYAREHNPDLYRQTLEAEAAHASVRAASALPDPSFQIEMMDVTNAATGGSATLLPGQVGTTRYLVSQSLPFYRKRDLRGQAAEQRATESDAVRDATRLEIEAGIKTAYARYYQASGRAAILTETRKLYEALEQVVFTRYGVGLVPQQDAIQIQSEITAIRIDLVDAERRRREAAAGLNALLARDADASLATPLGVPAAHARLSGPALNAILIDRSPELVRDQAAIEAARTEQALTLRDRYPDFALGVRDTRPKNGVDTWDVMLTMTVPLQQAARRSREAESGYRLEAAMAAKEAARTRLAGRLGQTLAGYESSREQADILRSSLLPQTRANLKAAQAGYETGQVNFNTLIQAERQVLKTRLELIDAETETAVSLAGLEQLTGNPL